MKSPIISTRISEVCKQKLDELQRAYPNMTVRQLMQQIIEHHHKRLLKHQKEKSSDVA